MTNGPTCDLSRPWEEPATTLLGEALAAIRVIVPEVDSPWLVKLARDLLRQPAIRTATIKLSFSPDKGGAREVEAILIPLTGFEGGPIEIALHHSPELEGDESILWCVTEPRSGLSMAFGFYLPHDALAEAVTKLAMSLAVNGRDGYEKRVVAQAGSLAKAETVQ